MQRLLDVRYRPQSRRPGMSKTRLGEALTERGIAYEHRRELGTPADIRWFFKHGRVAEGREAYRAQLDPAELERLAGELAVPTALMCLEADPADCHRRVITEELAALVPGLDVIDL